VPTFESPHADEATVRFVRSGDPEGRPAQLLDVADCEDGSAGRQRARRGGSRSSRGGGRRATARRRER
jgi:hypothetical protein